MTNNPDSVFVTSPQGFKLLASFDVGKAVSIIHFFQALGVRYGLGSKVEDITAPTDANLKFAVAPDQPNPSVDCSGLHRFIGWKSGGVLLPDGSVNQADFYQRSGFLHHIISQPNDPFYLIGLYQNYVYACFCKAGQRGENIGHVWYLVFLNGRWWSVESCGGHGPTMRPHDYPTLARIVTDVYPIAHVPV